MTKEENAMLTKILQTMEDHSKQDEKIVEMHADIKYLKRDMEAFGKQQQININAINELKLKPAKRWDAAVSQIIGIVIAAVAGGFLSKIL